MRRRWALAAPAAALLVAGAFWLGAHRAPARALVAAAAKSARPRSAVVVNRAPQPVEEAPAAEATSSPAARPPQVEIESFLQEYADEVCLCPDMACVSDVGKRYAPRMGHLTRAGDGNAIHESTVRVRDCVREIAGSG